MVFIIKFLKGDTAIKQAYSNVSMLHRKLLFCLLYVAVGNISVMYDGTYMYRYFSADATYSLAPTPWKDMGLLHATGTFYTVHPNNGKGLNRDVGFLPTA